MPKAIKKKVSKKETDAEIEVQDRIQDIKKVFEKKQKTLAAYGLMTLSAVIVIGGIALYRFNANDKAQQLEYEAYKTYYNLYRKNPLPGQEKAGKALELYQQAYAKKKSPRVLLSIADAYAELGQDDEALKTLEDFSKRYVREESLLPLALQKMASIQMKKGNSPEAMKTLDRIAAIPGDMLKDVVLIEKARLLEKEGKKDEAATLYKELSEKYPSSPYSTEAKGKIGEKKAG
ncbi:MAG TPA: tetratricopeptide repeat protein [Thermodesulfovibrionales bacterium]|nr:tetratricopeptide repeat protein [Thermodesulfovibrionales bacterium]